MECFSPRFFGGDFILDIILIYIAEAAVHAREYTRHHFLRDGMQSSNFFTTVHDTNALECEITYSVSEAIKDDLGIRQTDPRRSTDAATTQSVTWTTKLVPFPNHGWITFEPNYCFIHKVSAGINSWIKHVKLFKCLFLGII